jgi:hypothetical protein
MADIQQTDAILMYREPASIRPVESGSRAAAEARRALPPPELVRTARHGAPTQGIDPIANSQMAQL